MPNRKKPCSKCGRLLDVTATSLPAPVCRSCRADRAKRAAALRAAGLKWVEIAHELDFGGPGAARYAASRVTSVEDREAWPVTEPGQPPCPPGPCDHCGEVTEKRRNSYGRSCEACSARRLKDYYRNKNYRRYRWARATDVTPEIDAELRAKARRCPLCSVKMIDDPGDHRSKELDHIVPRAAGGTHTVGNVRVICRKCNASRPYDGSDLDGQQLSLWGMSPEFIPAAPVRPKRPVLRRPCGHPFGNGECMMRRCVNRRRAARATAMRAEGFKWQEIADVLGFRSTGAAHSAASHSGNLYGTPG